MGVFLHFLAMHVHFKWVLANRKAGSLPKKATKVKKEITRTAMATLRTIPIVAIDACEE